MGWTRKKSSVIDQRLDDLHREMSRIEREIKTGARGIRSPAKAAPSPVASTPSTDLFGHTGHASKPSPPLTLDRNTPPPAKSPEHTHSGRERFANYFMAGHFQDLRPASRQEVRVVRTKAILMLVLVLLALFWLFYFFGSH